MPFARKTGADVRLVLDTNVIVSGLFWSGPPCGILQAARLGLLELRVSRELLAELRDVVGRPKLLPRVKGSGLTPAAVARAYVTLAEVVEPAGVSCPGLLDPKDLPVLACAVAAQADAIVSGDHHLLKLKGFQGIAILTAAELLKRIEA